MKVIINLTFSPSGGSLSQVLHMIKEFNELEDVDVLIYSKESNSSLIKEVASNNKIILSRMSNISVITRVIWEQVVLPIYLLREKDAILFCPGNIAPIFSPIKSIVWIGTIGPFFKDFYLNFSWRSKARVYFNKFFMIASSHSADAVVFESNFTKKMFIDRYHINKRKAHVVNIGYDDFFHKTTQDDGEEVNNVYENDYILCVSHLYPYKNIIQLLQSYKNVVDNSDLTPKLVIAGSREFNEYNNDIDKCIKELSLENDVILLGMVSKEHLRNLYTNACIMVFPSPFENFAYTLVEAMSCGLPIVCSNTTAMPETCGDAAMYFDPYDVEDMSEKIILMLSDNELRYSYAKKSLLRIKSLPNYKKVTSITAGIMRTLLD